MNPRERMLWEIRHKYGLNAPRVLLAMSEVPREEFIAKDLHYLAYEDEPLAIGHGQTISQPYTVAFMTNLLDLLGNEKVLEIGTGSGYQAAVLSLLAREVFTIERIPELAKEAAERLKRLGFKNVRVREGGGEFGWKEEAPFDSILVTAGMDAVPEELFGQLKEGGILVAPVGEGSEKIMTKYKKGRFRVSKKEYGLFSFVPFIEDN